MKAKFPAITILILATWTLISIYWLLVSRNEIKDCRAEISDLSDQVDDLEVTIEELESTNTDLQGRIDLIQSEQEDNVIDLPGTPSSFYYNQQNSSQPISEKDVYLSQGSASVVYTQSGCDYVILESSKGFIVAEWYGGSYPYEGNTIAGNVNSYGMKECYNTSRNGNVKLYIDDFMLSKDRAMEKLAEKCN